MMRSLGSVPRALRSQIQLHPQRCCQHYYSNRWASKHLTTVQPIVSSFSTSSFSSSLSLSPLRISLQVDQLSRMMQLQRHPFSDASEARITGHQVLIDGQTIHYEQSGHGQHVVLLMPGALGTGKSDFLPQLSGLNGEEFTLVAWDPPGYGKSRPPDRDFTDFYRRDAAMAVKLMEKLGYRRYSVLGWSDGGITAMVLAASQPTSTVQRLIIWGSNAYVNDEDRELLRKVSNARQDWSPAFRSTFIEIYGEEYFYRLWDRLVANYMTLDDICKADLPKIECPVLILHGDLDPMVSSEHPVYLVNHLPNATLYRFPKGKHNIHQRYAEEFNKLVEDFLTTK